MPYYATEFDSPLPPPEVRKRLRRLLWTKRGFWDSAPSTPEARERWPYKGNIDESAFKLTPHPPRRSFSDTIRGTFEMSAMGGTHVRVVIRMSVAQALFVIVWFAGMSYFVFDTSDDLFFRVLLAAAAVWLIPGFYFRAIRLRNDLMRALDGKKRRAESPPLH
jgi:hypothetical protein